MNQTRKELFNLINQIIDLLIICNEESVADQFRSRVRRLQGLEDSSEEFMEELADLRKTLFGIGSFTDYAIYPRDNTELSEEEVEKKQWRLAEKLGETIAAFLVKA